MRIHSLTAQGFRGFKDLSVVFDPSMTTIVGENNSGKSCVASAIEKLLQQCSRGDDLIERDDFPYGRPGPLRIEAQFDFSTAETEEALVELALGRAQSRDNDQLRSWLRQRGTRISLEVVRPSINLLPVLRWGGLGFQDRRVYFGPVDASATPGSTWSDFIDKKQTTETMDSLLGDTSRVTFGTDFHFAFEVGNFILSKFKRTAEFRSRSTAGVRTNAVESLTGSDTASSLLNLRIHSNLLDRERYRKIVDTFGRLFPRFRIEAVEQQPGSGIPEIQFVDAQGFGHIPLSRISAGVHQAITLVINLTAMDNNILFVEAPEQHLHPHTMRFLHAELGKASEHNQVIVTTHEPHFVDPSALGGIRRFCFASATGTRVFGVDDSLLTSAREMGQMKTILKDVQNREVLFARSVIVVEDESQRNFLRAVSPTLGADLDANGVSVICAEGEGNYGPIWTTLDSLRIPYVALKDKAWNDDQRYPPDRFFQLGMELEEYLDAHGLEENRQEVIIEVGRNKPRVAQELGARITKEEIPLVFDKLLTKAVEIATGESLS